MLVNSVRDHRCLSWRSRCGFASKIPRLAGTLLATATQMVSAQTYLPDAAGDVFNQEVSYSVGLESGSSTLCSDALSRHETSVTTEVLDEGNEKIYMTTFGYDIHDHDLTGDDFCGIDKNAFSYNEPGEEIKEKKLDDPLTARVFPFYQGDLEIYWVNSALGDARPNGFNSY